MKLVVGPHDEQGFGAAREWLLTRFERWLIGQGAPDTSAAVHLAENAGLALDWKWSYGDGHLDRWRVEEIDEFLLEWCPRKLSMPVDQCGFLPTAVAAFADFLHSEGLLAPGSSPAGDLVEAADLDLEEFLEAMGESSNFGLAKSLFSAASADGVDLTDPAQFEEWIEAFNASSEEHRRQVLPDTALAPPLRLVLPPVPMPGDDVVARSKASAPIVALFAALAGYVGDGRKLTQTGNLTLADARALVDLLGTGDRMDERIGERTFKTKSSAELPALRLIYTWARKAGVVRVVHGKVVATKKGRAMAADPASGFDAAVDALFKLGPLSAQRDAGWWLAWPDVDELLDQLSVHLLGAPYVAQGPVPIDDLAKVAADAVLEAFRFPSLSDDEVARRVGRDVVDIIGAFELAGLVRRTGTLDPEEYARHRRGGSVELTPAGMPVARRLMEGVGYDAPTAGRFAAASAYELFMGTDRDAFAVVRAEIDAWLARRPPEQAAAELAVAVRRLGDQALRNMAFAALGEIDLAISGPVVRQLAAEPATKGFALCWLVEHELEDTSVLLDPDDPASFVDVLARGMIKGGPDALCDILALAGNHDQQARLLGQLWRSPSTATIAVLTAIGEVHPVKSVAKAARKGAFQRRSWNGPPAQTS